MLRTGIVRMSRLLTSGSVELTIELDDRAGTVIIPTTVAEAPPIGARVTLNIAVS